MPAQALKNKIAVVGASAAGLYAAGLLARAGASVEIFEQAERVEPFRRTLIVTSRMRDILGRTGEPSVVNQIHRFELFTDGRVAKIHFARPDLVIERSALLRSLSDEARAAGAFQYFGRRFSSFERTRTGLQLNLQTADGRFESRDVSTLIGADGAASKVARAGGWPGLSTVPLIQAIVKLPAEYPADTVRVWFIPDDTRYFYWLIPEGSGRGAVGLIGEDGAAARRALERFLEKKQLEPLSYQAARIPVYTRWVETSRTYGAGSIHLVGDAAAQVKVTTVGGIVTGLRGAAGVAESILNGSTRILSKLRRELDTHLLIRRALHDFQQTDYSRLVDLLNPGARDSLAIHTRDEAVRVLWHICRKQPRFVLLGLRGLITGKSFASAGAGRTVHPAAG